MFKKKSESDKMIREQLIPRGIRDERLLNAMKKIPREAFVPKAYRLQSYSDSPLPIGEGQTISQPYMVAVMTEYLRLKGDEKVLEIGTGSGYQAAILAELSKEVYTVERIESLSIRAKKVLESLGYKNVFFKVGNGTLGWEENAPYDAIIVTARTSKLPPPLLNQLKIGGRLVIPLGGEFSQVLTLFVKEEKLVKKEICNCVFVPLIGEFGEKGNSGV